MNVSNDAVVVLVVYAEYCSVVLSSRITAVACSTVHVQTNDHVPCEMCRFWDLSDTGIEGPRAGSRTVQCLCRVGVVSVTSEPLWSASVVYVAACSV
jgi:hypothetical protein